MMSRSLLAVFLAFVLSLAGTVAAQDDITPEMRTGWMELVRGSIDASSGAEVRSVRVDPVTGTRELRISIPHEPEVTENTIEEVRVVGRAPDKVELELPTLETRWVDDYDKDHYGLLVRLKDGPETPIRLFFSSHAGVLDGSVQAVGQW